MFDGTSKNDDWSNFIFKFEHIAKGRGWSRKKRYNRLILSLTGQALKYAKQCRMYGDYKGLKRRMTAAYGPKVNDFTKRMEADSVVQGKRDLNTFHNEVHFIIQDAYRGAEDSFKTKMCIEKFYKGVNQKWAVPYAMMKDPKTCSQAVKYLMRAISSMALNSPAPRGRDPRLVMQAAIEGYPEEYGGEGEGYDEYDVKLAQTLHNESVKQAKQGEAKLAKYEQENQQLHRRLATLTNQLATTQHTQAVTSQSHSLPAQPIQSSHPPTQQFQYRGRQKSRTPPYRQSYTPPGSPYRGPGTSRSPSRPSVCFNCNQEGHFWRACEKELIPSLQARVRAELNG